MDRELQIIVQLLQYMGQDKQEVAWQHLRQEITLDQSIIDHIEYEYLRPRPMMTVGQMQHLLKNQPRDREMNIQIPGMETGNFWFEGSFKVHPDHMSHDDGKRVGLIEWLMEEQ